MMTQFAEMPRCGRRDEVIAPERPGPVVRAGDVGAQLLRRRAGPALGENPGQQADRVPRHGREQSGRCPLAALNAAVKRATASRTPRSVS